MKTPAVTLRSLARAALERGETYFAAPDPCARGHTALRWTSNCICSECQRGHASSNYQANKAKIKRQVRAYAAANKDKVRAWSKAKVIRHRVRIQEAAKRRCQEDPTVRTKNNEAARRWRAKNPAKLKAVKRRWRDRHPEKCRAEESLRRARANGSQVGDRNAYARFVKWARAAKFIPCYWCKVKTRPGKRHLDHIIPLAKGGADAVANLCVSCPRCNQTKNAKLPEEFSGQAELRLA